MRKEPHLASLENTAVLPFNIKITENNPRKMFKRYNIPNLNAFLYVLCMLFTALNLRGINFVHVIVKP